MERIKKYQKKPVVIEAIQFKDDVDTITNISEFIFSKPCYNNIF